jgi:hypothetical protein
MSNGRGFARLHETLQELSERRKQCLCDVNKLHGAVERLRISVREAEAQRARTIIVVERKQELQEAETRLAFLKRACVDLEKDWQTLLREGRRVLVTT